MNSLHVFFHFFKRDVKDASVGWIFAILGFIPGFISALGAGHFLVPLMYYYFFFSIFVTTHVWVVRTWGSAGPDKTYLQSLPVPRDEMFFLCFMRAFMGSLPLGIMMSVGLPAFLGKDSRVLDLGAYFIAIVMIFMGLVFTQIALVSSGEMEKVRTITGRQARLVFLMRWLARYACDGGAVVAWFTLIMFMAGGMAWMWPLLVASAICVYFSFRIRQCYFRWLWNS